MASLLLFGTAGAQLTPTQMAVSAVAANTFMRSIFGAVLPLVAQPLFKNLGVHWACTLLGCIALLLGGTPFIFNAYGKR